MAENFSGGIVKEIIVRVVDQTSTAPAPIPTTPAGAGTGITGATGKKDTSAPARNASSSNAKTYTNAALQVATPALNAVTDGVAAPVIQYTRQGISALEGLAAGSAAALIPLIAGIAVKAVSSIVQGIEQTRARNESIASNLNSLNLERSARGINTIEFTQSGFLKKINYGGER